MKKTTFTLLMFCIMYSWLFAGGIVTNTNQSAAFIRTLVRDASIDVDAVFYNPAGLTHLEDGFYVQVNSQTVSQTRTVSSTFPGLNTDSYEGKTFVPVLPTAYLVYKTGPWAISAGMTVIGGGGTSKFDEGLPMFEYDMIQAMGDLASFGVSQYDANVSFEGSSSYFGFQGGVSYKINDIISVGAGLRYIYAKNTYTGTIENISYNFGGGDQLLNANTFFLEQAQALQPAVDGSQQIIDGGGGAFTLSVLSGSGIISAEQRAALEGGLLQLGYPQEVIDGLDVNTINAYFAGAQGAANTGAAETSDRALDVEQLGSGIAPFISVDVSLLEGNLGLAVKYEHQASMEVKTDVIEDNTGAGLFSHDEEVPAYMPGFISVGLRYKPLSALKLEAGLHYYLDESAQYGKKDDDGTFVTNGEEAVFGGKTTTLLEGNSIELGFSAEYDASELLSVSAGVLYTNPKPTDEYQSSISYTQSTLTFGGGVGLHLSQNFDLDLGLLYTSYTDYTKDFVAFEETYDKATFIAALGLTYKF